MGPDLALLRVAAVPPLIAFKPVVGALGLVICFHLRLLPARITVWTVSPMGGLHLGQVGIGGSPVDVGWLSPL